MLSALIFPIVFLLDLKPVVQQIVASIGFALAVLISMNALFLPKLLALLNDEDIGNDLKVGKKGPRFAGDANIHPTETDDHDKAKNKQEGVAFVASTQVLKDKTPDEKAEFIQEQILQWRAILMKTMEQSSTQSGSLSSAAQSSMLDTHSTYVIDENVQMIDHDISKHGNLEVGNV